MLYTITWTVFVSYWYEHSIYIFLKCDLMNLMCLAQKSIDGSMDLWMNRRRKEGKLYSSNISEEFEREHQE